jgi:hypothetical protein
MGPIRIIINYVLKEYTRKERPGIHTPVGEICMERLDPKKLNVEFSSKVSTTQPILGRKYTLTHSDITGELFLTIGKKFAYDKITSMRDEVLAEWKMSKEGPFLYVYVYVGDFEATKTALRNEIFRRELPLALEAIIHGDAEFFIAHPSFDNAPIWLCFDSTDPNYNRFEDWGIVKNFVV